MPHKRSIYTGDCAVHDAAVFALKVAKFKMKSHHRAIQCLFVNRPKGRQHPKSNVRPRKFYWRGLP